MAALAEALEADELGKSVRASLGKRFAFAHCADVREASEALREFGLRTRRRGPRQGIELGGPRRARRRAHDAGRRGTLECSIYSPQWLHFAGLLNLIRYQTFRAGAAVMTALLIGLIIGPRFIGWLRVRQGKGQPIRADGPQTHLAKRGTPTMGGLMILTALLVVDAAVDGPDQPLRLGVPVR